MNMSLIAEGTFDCFLAFPFPFIKSFDSSSLKLSTFPYSIASKAGFPVLTVCTPGAFLDALDSPPDVRAELLLFLASEMT